MNLTTVGTARDSKKWPARDRRKDPQKLDLIHFDLFNPVSGQRMLEGIRLLERLHSETPKTREFVMYKGVHINRLILRTAARIYEMALSGYLAGELAKRLTQAEWDTTDEIRKLLKTDDQATASHWVDISGMLAEKATIEKLINLVITQTINNIDALQEALLKISREYEDMSLVWVMQALKDWKNLDSETLSVQNLADILTEGKNNQARLNQMILKDAEKEFDQFSRIGFGPDGAEMERTNDFEAVRGKYESNKFILSMKEESAANDLLFTTIINRLNRITDR
jgi:hypothetical protein